VTVLLVATRSQVEMFRGSGIVPEKLPVWDVMESSTKLRIERQAGARRTLLLLWVGRLNENKDPLVVLEGVGRFAQSHPDLALMFVSVIGARERSPRRCNAASSHVFARFVCGASSARRDG
jgi:hypothetical protein